MKKTWEKLKKKNWLRKKRFVSYTKTGPWFRFLIPQPGFCRMLPHYYLPPDPGFSDLPTTLSRTAWFVIPHQTLTTCLFSKDVRRIDKSQPTRRQQSKEPTTDFVLSRDYSWTELWVGLSYWGEVWIYILFQSRKRKSIFEYIGYYQESIFKHLENWLNWK